MCLPPLTVDDVATVFTPHNIDDVKVNDPLLCGFNFLPYATFEILSSRRGGVVASRFDIEWSQTSYLSNADRRKYDYSLLEKSLLARSAGLSIKQVNDWFTNYRKRHWEQELVKAQALDFDDHSASSGSS